MIPDFYDGHFLPDGAHDATWQEVQTRFGSGAKRQSLCARMSQVLLTARRCGFREVFLFGSFISGKPDPGDIDLMWVYRSGSYEGMAPECQEIVNHEMMKARHGLDVFCCSDDRATIEDLLSTWRVDRDRTKKRGIVRIDLERFEGLII